MMNEIKIKMNAKHLKRTEMISFHAHNHKLMDYYPIQHQSKSAHIAVF